MDMQVGSAQQADAWTAETGRSPKGYRLLLLAVLGSVLVHLVLVWWLAGRWMPGNSSGETLVRIELGPPPLMADSVPEMPTIQPESGLDSALSSITLPTATLDLLPSPLPSGPSLEGMASGNSQGPDGVGWGGLELPSSIDEPETGFFGARAEGRRIAFVVDMSGSMTGARIKRTLGELCQSLRALPDFASVRVVFYSDDLYQPFGQDWVTLEAGIADRMCRRLISEIPDLVKGGTVPGPGFLAVMEGKHRPDAIFFLTDGEVGPASLMLDRVSAANRRRGLESVIHAVVLTHDVSAALEQAAPDSPLDRLVGPTGGSITIVPLGGVSP